ncbi:sensor histidine kinase [Thiothrix nivea]|uniref:Putative signal transduction histidine kinase n=1 Tax=Thiothrix nivea (strain ATCC 35100 / DSM 5205 / JP2) TaxID=870187 RepID=A0A656HN13_THINJ|nr:ATP-binding protein [Thiothrix nivea]EIJ36916.1 putative signal transduction histidine kinase [Thiothrix nivea DSM 5205]
MSRAVFIWSGVLLCYVLLVSTFSYRFLFDAPSKDNFGSILDGVSVYSATKTPGNLPEKGWSRVYLPDRQLLNKQGLELWYRLDLDGLLRKYRDDRLAIYLPGVSGSAEFFINSLWIKSNKNTGFPVYRGRGKLSILILDKDIFLPENNKLYVHLSGSEGSLVYLDNVYVGAVDSLTSWYKKSELVRHHLILFVVILLTSFGLFVIFFWFLRKKDTYYLWFSLASFLWAVHNAYNSGLDGGEVALLWDIIAPLGFGWSVVFIVLFLCEVECSPNHRIRWKIISGAFLFSLPFFYLNPGWIWFYAYKIWFAFVTCIGLYAVLFLIDRYRENANQNTLLMLLTGISIILFGLHDLLVKDHYLDVSSPFLLHFSALLSVIVIIKILLGRFMDGIRMMENYNQELQSEVHLKRKAIESNYAKIQKLQNAKILSQERERIMRDLHDGIGGSLVAVLASLETSQIKPNDLKCEVQHILQDLRLVIDSMDNNNGDIATVLGMLRERLDKQLRYAKFVVKWRVTDLPGLQDFGPEKALSTMRIVQEAISNAIKHSGAKTLTVSTYILEDDGIKHAAVEIKDDGNGQLLPSSQGRGLKNMRKRAKQVGATLWVDNQVGQGVVVRLAFPVNGACP